jgi:hypothetical protein
MTRPLAAADGAVRILPTEQKRFLIARFAACSGFPTTFGTTHGSGAKSARTATSAVTAIVHLPVPLQAPDQRTNLEPLAGFAFNLTVVP